MSKFAALRERLTNAGRDVPVQGVIVSKLALSAGLTLAPVAVFTGFSGMWGAFTATSIPAMILLAYARLTATRSNERGLSNTGRIGDFENIIDHLRDAILQFDASGKLIFGSRSSTELFGCERYELAGNGLIDRTHVGDRPLLMTALSDAREGGKERIVEVRMRRDTVVNAGTAPDFVWVEANMFPSKTQGEEQAPFGVVMTLRDISQRKQNELLMQKARKEAEEASHAKNQFLAVIGHELRTPLNAIVGFSDMMSSGIGGQLDPTHEEYAKLINQSGHHLLEMVNMLLDMSKIEAGRFEIQPDSFEPEKLIAPCMQIVSKAAREKNVSVEVEIGRNIPEIIGDERACRQMAINLLSNAVKFSNAGGRVVWSIKRQGKFLKMTVSDRGIGMSSEVLNHLGEPFFQAQNTADRRYEGTGLGVSIVRGLVELHDGTINYVSEEGVGTTVTVQLPIDGPSEKKAEQGHVTSITQNKEVSEKTSWEEPKRIAQ